MTEGPIPYRVSDSSGYGSSTVEDEIRAECGAIADMLVEKNKAYGDSALTPVRIFSRASTTEQLKVRLDDKLSRLARGHAAGEDVTLDLIGYGVLLRIAERREAALRSAPCEVATFTEDDGSTSEVAFTQWRKNATADAVKAAVLKRFAKAAKKGRAR